MLIRYPGSKDQHFKYLLQYLESWESIVEPFAGTAAVTFGLLAERRRRREPVEEVVLNDLDPEIASLWRTVYGRPEALIKRIEAYRPRVDDFYRIQETPLGRWDTDLDAAFNKIVIHQISYSGMGRAAGSPIGGRTQLQTKGEHKGEPSKFLVDCRWNPELLAKKVQACHELLRLPRRVRIENNTAVPLLDSDLPVYLDPPYSVAGPTLYHRGHVVPDLVEHLTARTAPWVMSYDAPGGQEFIGRAQVHPLPVVSHLHHKPTKDVIIVPFDYPVKTRPRPTEMPPTDGWMFDFTEGRSE